MNRLPSRARSHPHFMIHLAVGSVLPAFLFLQAPGTPASAILGTWRGTSICVDRATDRSCRDETVVYEVDSAAGPSRGGAGGPAPRRGGKGGGGGPGADGRPASAERPHAPPLVHGIRGAV